jgi:hypothetical protein
MTDPSDKRRIVELEAEIARLRHELEWLRSSFNWSEECRAKALLEVERLRADSDTSRGIRRLWRQWLRNITAGR